MPKKITEVETLSKGTGQENVLVVAGNSLKQIPWRSISRPDASADYVASGAASLEAWATMAKTDDATKYRVAAGRYSISDADAEIGCLITIIDTPGVSYRTVWVASVTDYAFVDCYTTLNPGGAVEHVVAFDTESNLLEINGQLVTLPAYTAADAGKHLTIGTDGTPQWATKPSYDAEDITCQYTNIDGQNCDTVREALDAIGFDMGLLRPPHIMISLTSTSDGTIITGATKNDTAISLTNASGAADYTALLAAINSAVPKGGNVELCIDSYWYYSGAVYRNAGGVIITYYDLVNPLEINDGMSFYRCWITKTSAEISVKEV